MSIVNFTIRATGITPLLMHKDNLEHQDRMKSWISNPDNKKKSVAGDDRTPGFTWIGGLYTDANGEKVVIENEMFFGCLIDAGKKVIKQKSTTYKKLIPASVFSPAFSFPLLLGGKEVLVGSLLGKLHEEMDYSKHCEEVSKLGFSLFAKRAGVNGKKHVRVRPRFETWSFNVSGTVDTEIISEDIFVKLVDIAGSQIGIGDWRPSAPIKPGPYGMFKTEVKFGK